MQIKVTSKSLRIDHKSHFCCLMGMVIIAPGRKQEQGSQELLIRTWPAVDFFGNLYLSSPVLSLLPSLCSLLSTPSFPLLLYGRLSSYQAFLDVLNEMNDYAGQRELIAENMMMSICIDLTKYLQGLKQERKTVSSLANLGPIFAASPRSLKWSGLVGGNDQAKIPSGKVFHHRSPPEKSLIRTGTLLLKIPLTNQS